MKRLVVGIALSLIPASSFAYGPVTTCEVTIPNDDLNTRATPDGQIIGRLFNGTKIVILDPRNFQGQWVYVALPVVTQDGPTAYVPMGWAYGKYLTHCVRERNPSGTPENPE